MVLLWTASCEVLPPQPGSPVVDGAKFCLWFQSLKVQIASISKMWSLCIPSETLIVLWKGKGFFKSSLHDFAGSSLRWRVHQGGTLQLRCQPRPQSLDWRHASMSWKQPLDWCTRRGDTCHDMNEGRDTWHACDWVLSSKMLYCSLFIFSHFLGFGVTCSRRSDDACSQACKTQGGDWDFWVARGCDFWQRTHQQGCPPCWCPWQAIQSKCEANDTCRGHRKAQSKGNDSFQNFKQLRRDPHFVLLSESIYCQKFTWNGPLRALVCGSPA